ERVDAVTERGSHHVGNLLTGRYQSRAR
ncbi:MAG: hypothetical protein JWM82_3988, partial [Myxococcales bacterium]|nr:hypothetical protein [Myxococcales bacterium]